MAKFILIDHSITDLSGHHYEYAVRVLRAAEAAGYEPQLATNRNFEPAGLVTWRTFPVYKYGFWFASGVPLAARCAKTMRDRLRGVIVRAKSAWLYSPLGAVWTRRHSIPEMLAMARQIRSLPSALPLACGLYLVRLALAVGRLIGSLLPWRSQGGEMRQAWRLAAATLIRPLRVALFPPAWLKQWAFAARKQTSFAADSRRLFGRTPLSEGDLVFIPTLGEPEMLALVDLFAREPRTRKATWHLLFRRNIYAGRDGDYGPQDEQQRELRNSFRQFQLGRHGQRVFFYTDTVQLTEQYNRLGVERFQTLPIPVNSEFRQGASTPAQDRWQIAYVGDARTEKGYQFLPRIVQDLEADRRFQGRLRFVLQSNFNVPDGEPAPVVARAQLESLPPEQVRLLTAPLNSQAYRQLLLEADVVLVPYDCDNYYARSSGVFAEAMAAGKPVVVPGGTWMATQLASALCDYHQNLRSRFAIDSKAPWWQVVGRGAAGGEANQTGSQRSLAIRRFGLVKPPPGASHVLISYLLTEEQPGTFVKVTAEQFAPGRRALARAVQIVGGGKSRHASVLAPLAADVRRIRLELTNAYASATLALESVRIDFLAAPAALPSGVVGAIYSQTSRIAESVSEVLAHYPHYHESALTFSQAWGDYHNPESLVGDLAKSGASGNLSAPQGRANGTYATRAA